MDQERQRIQEDLRGLLDGDVHCEDVFQHLYSSDASIYEVRPRGVVRPRHVGDVVACVNYAAENELSLHPRGAGSGVAGESLGAGVVLDFSCHMRRVNRINEQTVRVQPGVVLGQLNELLGSSGRIFGPDPATGKVSTMGGVLAKNGSGSRLLRYGPAAERVESLQVVLANGQVTELGRHSLNAKTGDDGESLANDLARRVAELLRRESGLIEQFRPETRVPGLGYDVFNVLQGDTVDLARLMVGSEGTLGIITEATLRTDALPAAAGVALLFFERQELAAKAVQEILPHGVSACDLMDRRLLSLARESDPRFENLIPRDAEALLLVEHAGADLADVAEALQRLVVRVQRRKRLAFDARIALEPEEVDLYWQLPERVVPSLYQLKRSLRPLPFVEDMTVPPAKLPGFLMTVQNILKELQITASLFAHAGHGQLHLRPFLDLSDPEHVRSLHSIATRLYAEVFKLGGTISAEHGLGLSRSWYVRQHCAGLHDLYHEVKRIFDPTEMLNPGKVSSDAAPPITKHLRHVAAASSPPGETTTDIFPVDLLQRWDPQDAVMASRQCNGCARCRTEAADQRMCPIFRYAPREEASPRSKANLMRAVLTGEMHAEDLAQDEVKQFADLCVHCHQCRLECPAAVDIPKLMVEAKAQYVATNGLRWRDWLLTRPDRLGAWGSMFAPLTNWALTNPQMRWVLEKLTGIAQGRKLPQVTSRSYLRRAHRLRLTRPNRQAGPKVLYFLDIYANWFDVELATAFVRVMQHNGFTVYVPSQQTASGMALVTQGAIDKALDMASRNVPVLAEAVRQGYEIVTTEPSAALCLSHEYQNLMDDEDARLVAEHSHEACDFLWQLHQQGRLELDLSPLNYTVGYHQPCHSRALNELPVGGQLLRLIPGLTVQAIERGCSGMAGLFGLRRENYRSSLRAGWDVISSLRAPEIQVGATECSACKIQMEQGTTKPTVHPVKILALAYGLMPELQQLLQRRGEPLRVT